MYLNPMRRSFLKSNGRSSSTMTKVLKKQKVGRNKSKSFHLISLNKRELNIALFLRDIYISNKGLQSIYSCLHDTWGEYNYSESKKDKEIYWYLRTHDISLPDFSPEVWDFFIWIFSNKKPLIIQIQWSILIPEIIFDLLSVQFLQCWCGAHPFP